MLARLTLAPMLVLLAVAPASAAPEPKSLNCTFASGVTHVYEKGGFIHEAAAPLTFGIASINTAAQTADLKTERRQGTLVVKSFHLEPGVRRSGALEDAFERALDRLRRVIGLERIEVPISASAPRASRTISASLSPWGVCQPAAPSTTSHPSRSNSRWVSPLSSAGAKMKTFAIVLLPRDSRPSSYSPRPGSVTGR